MLPASDDVPWIDGDEPLPDPRSARRDGLVAVGGSLTVARLVEAYPKGIFPWTVDPVTWWSPDPRAIFDLDHIHIPRSLKPAIHRAPFDFRITYDAAFDAVIEACAAAPRDGDDSWITQEFIAAYQALHRASYAHSIELWKDGALVAGIYGVAFGGFFAGESMFHRQSNASKIALVLLQQHLHEQGFALFDTQMFTPVTEMMGAQLIPREEYLERLSRAIKIDAKFC